jgi:2-oxoglutarate ferredoxin oxidoreductase subunit gamma
MKRCGIVPSKPSSSEIQRLEVLLSGSGGQGIILAATVLAEAACTAGFEVLATQSYGPEARGGASRAEVIVAREPIDYLAVDHPDVSVCLSQPAFDKFAGRTRDGGIVVYDSGLVQPRGKDGGTHLVGAPCTELARRHAGTPLAANMVVLGVLERVSPFVGYEALIDGVHAHLPSRLLEANLQALYAGYRLEL